MNASEAQGFIEKIIELSALFEANPALIVRRDVVVKDLMRRCRLNQIPAEVMAVACQTIAIGLIAAPQMPREEKPRVELVQ